jgi:hypothetical protein
MTPATFLSKWGEFLLWFVLAQKSNCQMSACGVALISSLRRTLPLLQVSVDVMG